jgi:hypothetical protein
VITNGQVAENDATLVQLFARLNATAEGVYLLALDDDKVRSGQTFRRYRQVPLAGTTRIGNLTRGKLAQAIAKILIAEAGLTTLDQRGQRER